MCLYCISLSLSLPTTHCVAASIVMNQAFEMDYPKLVKVFSELLVRIEQFSAPETPPSSLYPPPPPPSHSSGGQTRYVVGSWVFKLMSILCALCPNCAIMSLVVQMLLCTHFMLFDFMVSLYTFQLIVILINAPS